MALGTNGSTLNDELNRLANGGTYRNMDQMVDEALAAKQWANREYINPYSTDTVGILNEIAGLGLNKKNWFDFNGVCNYLAGTTGLPAAAALRQIQNTSDLITSNATYYVDAIAPTGSTTPGYVYLNGVGGNYLSSPDSSVLDITGDIDIRVQVAMDNWIPASNMTLLGKWGVNTTQSYLLWLRTDGKLEFAWTTTGSYSASFDVVSSITTGINNGATKWVRVTLDVDNGASGRDIKFWTSDDNITYTQLGTTTTTAGTTSIYSGSSNLTIGADDATGLTRPAAGKFYRAQVLNGIDGTVVFNANMASVSLTATSFTESSSNAATVTINGFRAYPQDVTNLGTGGDLLPTTLGSSTAADSNDPKFLDFTGTNYVYLPGVSGNYLEVLDNSSLDITGDIDLRVYVALDDWTPAASQRFITKRAASNYSYTLGLGTTGIPFLGWTTDGTTITSVTATVAPTIADGASLWIRGILDVDNGAGQYDVKFYTSTDGTTWTQLGTTVTSGFPTSIFSGSANVQIGADLVASAYSTGKLFRAQIFNGIDGTKVLDVDTSVITSGADTYVVPVTYTGQAGAYFTGTGLSLNGVAGNYVSTPDASTLDITGDIDLQCKVALADWTPSAVNYLIGKYNTSNISYALRVDATGTIGYVYSTNGTTATVRTSTVAPTVADGATLWIRVTHDVDNGASGNDVKFYTSTDGTTWTQLGTTVTNAGTVSIFSGTASLEIGSIFAGTTGPANGTFYRAIVKSGIGGYTVFDADFTQVPANALRMTESSLNAATVSLFTTRYATINRSTSGRKSVAVTQPTWLFGTDDYMEVNNRYMSSGTYLYLPGVVLNDASAADATPIKITGDIDLRAKVAMDDWTPNAESSLISKMNSGNLGYGFTVLTTGRLRFYWSTTGSNQFFSDSTVSPTVTDGSTLWVRVTFDVDNGAAGNTAVFYTSTDGTTWTQLGSSVVTAGVTSIFGSTTTLRVGAAFAGNQYPLRGKFFRAQVLNGIGGTVAFDANFETSITSLNQTSFTESSTNAATVTINRSGSAYRSAGITAAGYLYPGATNTFRASATSLLDFGAADSFTAVAVVRQWATVPTGTTLAKNTSLGTATIGYALYNTSTLSAFRLVGPSGTTDLRTVAISTGTLQSSIGTRNTVADTISLTYNSSTSSITDPTSSLSNFDEFRIGRLSGSGTSYNDMELYGAAVFRSALTATQIRQIVNYFANREVYL